MRIQCISRPRSTWSLPTTGNVVFGDARGHARRAAGAHGLIDGHAPRVAFVLVLGVHRHLGRRRVHHVLRELGLVAIRRQRPRADDRAAFHRMVALGRREQDRFAGPAHVAAGKRQGVCRANRVAVVAHARADPARARAPVAEVHRDGTGDVTRLNECRPGHRAAAHRDRHVVAVADAERLRGRRRHQHGVVPRQLRQRLGEFLQPAVVGEATVVDRRVRRETPPRRPR